MRRLAGVARAATWLLLSYRVMAVVWVFLAGARWATGGDDVLLRLVVAVLCWIVHTSERDARAAYERGVAAGQKSAVLAGAFRFKGRA